MRLLTTGLLLASLFTLVSPSEADSAISVIGGGGSTDSAGQARSRWIRVRKCFWSSIG